MRLITRCPACGTLFKVVPDQLRISEGWVRCGHCAEVFDAAAHFHDPDAPVTLAAPEPPAAPASEWSEPAMDASMAAMAPSAVSGDASSSASGDVPASRDEPIENAVAVELPPELPATLDLPTDAVASYVPPSVFAPPFEDDAAQAAVTAPVAQASPGPSAPEPAMREADDSSAAIPDAPDPQAVPLAVETPTPDAPAIADVDVDVSPEAATAESAATPAFVRQADRRAFWRRPAVRSATVLLVLVALLGLLAQVIRMERDRIAAYVPAARPVLEQACEWLGCEVGALRRIEAIVVDGSSFTRMRADTYRLGLVLKNSGGVDVAMPSVELTLSNLQGQTVVRRVLLPADLGAARVLGAGAEWVGDVPVLLEGGDVAARVAGYAVLPFYP